MQTWLHNNLLMNFINICSSALHLSWSSNPIPSGSQWKRQHHMWQLLFLHSILNWECSLYCVLLHNTLIRVCAHTVILEQYAPQSTRFHSGTSRPHCARLIDANLRPSWRSRFVVVGKVRWEGMLICIAWDHFQVHFAVDYSLARWRWHLDSAALTEHIHLKAQTLTKATE